MYIWTLHSRTWISFPNYSVSIKAGKIITSLLIWRLMTLTVADNHLGYGFSTVMYFRSML